MGRKNKVVILTKSQKQVKRLLALRTNVIHEEVRFINLFWTIVVILAILGGMDALLSIVQMPKGVPVACME
jgi:hypothetical protein